MRKRCTSCVAPPTPGSRHYLLKGIGDAGFVFYEVSPAKALAFEALKDGVPEDEARGLLRRRLGPGEAESFWRNLVAAGLVHVC